MDVMDHQRNLPESSDALEALSAGTWVMDADGSHLRWCRGWGTPTDGDLDPKLEDRVHPDDLQRIRGLLSSPERYAGPFSIGFRLRVSSGYRRILAHGSATDFTPEGTAARLAGIWMDADACRHGDDDSLSSERRFQTFTELSPVATMIYTDGVWTYANRAALEISGYTESELIGMPFWNLVHPEDRELVKQRGLARQSGEEAPPSYDFRILRKDGATRWIDFRARALDQSGGPTPVLISAQDVTEHKRVERIREVLLDIARSAHSLDSVQELYPEIQSALGELFDTTNLIITLYDRDQDMLSLAYSSDQKDRFASFPAGKTLTGYIIRTNKPLLVRFDEIMEMEKRGLVEIIGTPCEIWMAAPLRAMGVTMGAIVVQSYDDSNAYDSADLEVLTFVGDQIGLFIDRARAVESLRDSEELFRAVFETARDSIFVKDSELRYVRVNHAMEDLFGLSRRDILGRTETELFGPETGGREEEVDRSVLRGQVVEELPEKNIRGVRRVFHTVKVPLRNAAGRITGLCGISRDITERRKAEEDRKRLEQQMLEVQKMESLGIMAGGIAHDFNNILVAILGNAEMALEGSKLDAATSGRLRKVRSAAMRASELARQMLAYAGRASFQVEILDLSKMVSELFDIMRASIPRRIEIDCRIPESAVTVEGDAVQIRQVAMNLITNAAEAIEGKGCIEVMVSLASEDEVGERAGLPRSASGYALLRVSDDGCGMDADTLDRIFDPFYSTKFSGSGLGLSAVMGIMHSHGGTILVDSKPGSGTSFTAVFPSSPVEPAGDGSEGAEVRHSCCPSGRILVVDDEEMVREVASGMLDSLGCASVTAGSGKEALKLLEESDDEIGLVMLDLTMPGMDGEETFERLREKSPQLPVIVFSGYSREDLRRRFEGRSRVTLMQKPFTMESLEAALREITGEGPGSQL